MQRTIKMTNWKLSIENLWPVWCGAAEMLMSKVDWVSVSRMSFASLDTYVETVAGLSKLEKDSQLVL